VGKTSMAKFLLNTKKNWYELSEEDKKKGTDSVEKESFFHQLMITAFFATQDLAMNNYDNCYLKTAGRAVTLITEALEEYGFTYTEPEHYKIMEGTHELFTKPKTE